MTIAAASIGFPPSRRRRNMGMSTAKALLRAGNIGGCNPGDSCCQHRIPPSRRGRHVRMSRARALLRAGNISGCNPGD